jgi:hypothetical protein
MPPQHDTLTAFFKQYEQTSNSSDTESMLAQFAESFTVATPQGPQIIRATDFARVLPRRKALFDHLGCQAATLDSLKATHLNDHFALVDTTWRMRFSLPNNRSDEFVVASSFMVYIEGSAAKIFLYMPHQDIMQMLRDRGILTSTSTEAPLA